MLQTVLGEIDAKDVKMVLPHEHLYSDLRSAVAPLDNGIFYDKVALENLGELLRNPYAVLDNALLPGLDVQEKELLRMKNAGCNLLADVTTVDFGRDPLLLKETSQKTGVHIIAGCGSYVDCYVDGKIKEQSVEEMRKTIINDLTVGMDGTDIKAGVIGEVGSSMEITQAEYKFLQAAAEAQAETGFGMHIHACLWNAEGLKALKFAVSKGANPEKICVDHADVRLNEDYILGVLNEGAYIEFDDFGKEFYVDRRNRNLLLNSFATDIERCRFIKKLIEKGFKKQILVTTDVCLKNMLHTYGGWGYDHIFTNIIPMLEDVGLSAEDINMIVRENPIRFLDRT